MHLIVCVCVWGDLLNLWIKLFLCIYGISLNIQELLPCMCLAAFSALSIGTPPSRLLLKGMETDLCRTYPMFSMTTS